MAAGDQSRLMESHVLKARAELENGHLVRDALEGLWRAAFAAGVGAGQVAAAHRAPAPAPPGSLARLVATAGQGWHWGSAALHGLVTAGALFSYGGTDASGPNCDRPAVITGMRKGRMHMQLTDTGEEVPVTVMFWARVVGEGEGDGG